MISERGRMSNIAVCMSNIRPFNLTLANISDGAIIATLLVNRFEYCPVETLNNLWVLLNIISVTYFSATFSRDRFANFVIVIGIFCGWAFFARLPSVETIFAVVFFFVGILGFIIKNYLSGQNQTWIAAKRVANVMSHWQTWPSHDRFGFTKTK